jgi:hypothetical protein
MTNSSYNAVVERNVAWKGAFASEPYECGWAREAVFFVRTLLPVVPSGDAGASELVAAKVQISPDGIRWIDEGSSFSLPKSPDQTVFCRVAHFGNWLRIVGDTAGAELRVLVTLSLKS